MLISVSDEDAPFSLLLDFYLVRLHPLPPPLLQELIKNCTSVFGALDFLLIFCEVVMPAKATHVSVMIPPLSWTWARRLSSPVIRKWPVCFFSERPASFDCCETGDGDCSLCFLKMIYPNVHWFFLLQSREHHYCDQARLYNCCINTCVVHCIVNAISM